MTGKVNYSKFFLITSLVVYLSLNAIAKLYDRNIKVQLEHCDVNKNGFLESDELTNKDCYTWFEKSYQDTARTFSHFTLIPVSLLIGLVVVFFGKFVNWLRRKKATP